MSGIGHVSAETVSWREANAEYLCAGIELVRAALARYIAALGRGEHSDALVRAQMQGQAGDERLKIAEAEFRERGRGLAASGRPAALDTVADLFGLSPFERMVVLLAAAPAFAPGLDRVYAYAQDDASLRWATPALAMALFSPSSRDSFLPDAPLRRYRLIEFDHGSIRLDERMTAFLDGANRLDEGVAHLLQPVPAAPLTPELDKLAGLLAKRLHAIQGRIPVVNLIGVSGAGKRAVAHAICERIGFVPYALDATLLPGPGPERIAMLRLLERESRLARLAVYVDGSVAPGVIERCGALTLVGSTKPWPGEAETLTLRLPALDAAGRHALWEQALNGGGRRLDGQIETVVQQFAFGPDGVRRAVARAQSNAALQDSGDAAGMAACSAACIWDACREQARGSMEDLAQRIDPRHGWDDLVLPPQVMAELRDIAAQVAHRGLVYGRWGFGTKLTRGRGIGSLFSGPSGTGKTLAAEILAAELALDLYRIDLSAIVSKYIGETEKNLRRIFDAAEESGAILFFDEADALFGKRSEVKDSHDRYANIEIDYLLQRMEEYGGLAILATNMKSLLDPAFLRRLRFVVEFPFPDSGARARIWRGMFPPQAPLDGIDFDELARMEIPGGSISNIALGAAFLAAQRGTAIGVREVALAAKREFAKIQKPLLESELGPLYRKVKG